MTPQGAGRGEAWAGGGLGKRPSATKLVPEVAPALHTACEAGRAHVIERNKHELAKLAEGASWD